MKIIPTKNDKPVSIQTIRNLQKKGKSVQEIAQITGISRQAVYQKIKADDIKRGELTPVDEAVRKLANPSTRAVALKMGDEKTSAFVRYHIDLLKMGQGVDKSDVPGLYERFYRYLEYCVEHGIAPNNMSAYLAIGITYQEVYQWKGGREKTPEHKKFAEDLSAFFASIHEQGGTDGIMNPIQTIFWQKAYDGLSDQPKDIEITVNPLGEKRSAEQIAKDYSNLPD